MHWINKTKPDKCPVCGATTLAEIRYGLIRPTPKQRKEIREGKWVMGGCIFHPALPKWVCMTCSTKIIIRDKKKEIDVKC